MTLHLLSVIVLGLMCGSELNVAAFAHPMLSIGSHSKYTYRARIRWLHCSVE